MWLSFSSVSQSKCDSIHAAHPTRDEFAFPVRLATFLPNPHAHLPPNLNLVLVECLRRANHQRKGLLLASWNLGIHGLSNKLARCEKGACRSPPTKHCRQWAPTPVLETIGRTCDQWMRRTSSTKMFPPLSGSWIPFRASSGHAIMGSCTAAARAQTHRRNTIGTLLVRLDDNGKE